MLPKVSRKGMVAGQHTDRNSGRMALPSTRVSVIKLSLRPPSDETIRRTPGPTFPYCNQCTCSGEATYQFPRNGSQFGNLYVGPENLPLKIDSIIIAGSHFDSARAHGVNGQSSTEQDLLASLCNVALASPTGLWSGMCSEDGKAFREFRNNKKV